MPAGNPEAYKRMGSGPSEMDEEMEAEEEAMNARAEELGRLIEAKDWKGVLTLLDGGGMGLMIEMGPAEDEEI